MFSTYILHCTSPRSVKALGEVDSDEDDSALSWVDKMRQKEEEKRLAQERVSVNRVWLLGVQGCCLGCRGAAWGAGVLLGVLLGVQGCCLGCRGAAWGAGVLLGVQGWCLGCRGAAWGAVGVQGCCLGCRGAAWSAGVLLGVPGCCLGKDRTALCVSVLASPLGDCWRVGHVWTLFPLCTSAGQVVGGDG